MIFTDDALKRLKELNLEELIQLLIRLKECELKSEHPTDAAKRIWEFLMIDPLLARLEAAEKLGEALRNRGACYCETYEGMGTIELNHTRQCKEETTAKEAWRKAAGK